MRAFVNPSRFRGNSGLATWLTRIALNEALGDLAADDARVVAFPSPAPTAEAEAGRSQMRAAVLERLGGFGELYPFDGARCVGMADRVVARLVEERRETPGP